MTIHALKHHHLDKRSFVLLARRVLLLLLLTTLPVWAQLAYSFNTVSPTSLNYGGTEYADSTTHDGIAQYNGIPWIFTYQRPDNSTYASDYFSCPGIVLSMTGPTVTGTCAKWTFHFSYTYSKPDPNTLKIAYTLYNDNTTDTITQVVIPMAGITLPHPYTSDQTGVGNPTPINGFFDNLIAWSSAASDVFTSDTSGWYVSTTTTTNAPDSNHDELDFFFQNHQSSGNCTYFCQNYYRSIAPSSSYTVNFYIRFASPSASHSSLQPEVISAWNTTYSVVVNWVDRRPIGMLQVANSSETSPINPGGYFNDPTCNCTDPATFHARLQTYITNTLNTVSAYGFPLQGFIFWDLEGEESQSLNYVGDPSSLPTVSPQMNNEVDSMMKQLTTLGYRVGMTIRANHFNYGPSLPPTPCTYNAPFKSDNEFFNPPFFLSTGTYLSRVYTCDPTSLTWTPGGFQSQYIQTSTSSLQSEAATDIINKATYAYNRWGATLFYVDSNSWYGGGQYAPQIWRQIQAALPNCLFIPEHSTSAQFAYSSAYNDAGQSGDYNSAEHGWQLPYQSAFLVSFNNGTTNAHVAEIAAGMCHGDIYGLQAWYPSGEASVLAAAMMSRSCGVAPSAPTGLAATVN